MTRSPHVLARPAVGDRIWISASGTYAEPALNGRWLAAYWLWLCDPAYLQEAPHAGYGKISVREEAGLIGKLEDLG